MSLASPANTRELGQAYENHALKYLCQQGLQPVCRNFETKVGEIDLIMREGEWVVFVEVRMRGQTRYAGAAETVTRAKQRRIIACAKLFLLRRGWYEKYPCRFDLLALTRDNHAYSVEWIRSAFT